MSKATVWLNISALVAALLFAPIFLMAATGDVVCDPASVDKKPVKTEARDSKEASAKVGSKSKWTNEKVKTNKDGTVEITSSCGVEGTPGKICAALSGGKEVCTKKPESGERRAELAKSMADGKMQNLARQESKRLSSIIGSADPDTFRNVNLTRSREISDILDKYGYGSYKGMIEDHLSRNPEDAQNLIKAIAAGDEKGATAALSGLGNEDYARAIARDAITKFQSNPEKIYSLLPTSLQMEARESSGAVCGYISACPEVVAPVAAAATGFAEKPEAVAGWEAAEARLRGETSIDERTPTTPAAGPTRILVSPNGKVDEVTFYKRAVEEARAAGLDGYIEPRLAARGLLTTGSAEEWGRLYTMMAKQESGFDINAANPRECSYGILQFCPGQYGLGGMDDVKNPESALKAVIKVTEQGKLFQYFGPLQRLDSTNEITKHANWFNSQIAPYADGSVPYTPVAGGVPYVPGSSFGSRLDGFVNGPYQSPGSDCGPVGGMGNMGGMLSSLLGSGGGGLGSLLSGLFGTNTPQPGMPGSTQPPLPPIAPEPPAGGGLAQTAPSLILTANKKTAAPGQTVNIIWAATGVSTCGLFGGEATEPLTTGKSGTYKFTIPFGSTGTMSLSLECIASDPRVSSSPSAHLEIAVQ